MKSLTTSLFLILALLSGREVAAQTLSTWIGGASGDWVDSGGAAWSGGTVPANSGSSDVRIDNNTAVNAALSVYASNPQSGADIIVGRLQIDAGDSPFSPPPVRPPAFSTAFTPEANS